MTSKKTTNRMPTETFVPLYLAAVEKGMNRQDFAESIGVTANTVYQRIHDMWVKGACQKTFPQLKARGKRSFMETVERAVAAYRSGSATPETKPEPKKELAKVAAKVGRADDFNPQDELDRLLTG